MLLAGDEIGRTQNGNNNAYCQDNEISWLDWDLTPKKESLLKFVRRVIGSFAQQPVFHRRRFFHGKAIQGAEAPEIAWLDPSGKEMTEEAWKSGFVRCLGVQLFGGRYRRRRARRADLRRHDAPALINADHANTIPFVLSRARRTAIPGRLVFDTARPELNEEDKTHLDEKYDLEPCSIAVFRSPLPRVEETV